MGPPEGLTFSPSGTFVLRDALPVVPCWRGLVQYTPAACDPPATGVRLPSPLVQGFVIGALSDSEKGEGNEEGDELEFVEPSKETSPRKEISEVDEELQRSTGTAPRTATGSLFCPGPKSTQS